jgi:CMP-N-acetylneuraminic acid synthetase
MFAEQLVIALVADQDRVLDVTEQNAARNIETVASAIEQTQSNQHIDVVVVSSDDSAVLALAQDRDAVNLRGTGLPAGIGATSAAVKQMLDEGFVDEESWMVCLGAAAGSPTLTNLIDRAFEVLQVNAGAVAATAIDGATGQELLQLFQVAAFVESNGLPVEGAVVFME